MKKLYRLIGVGVAAWMLLSAAACTAKIKIESAQPQNRLSIAAEREQAAQCPQKQATKVRPAPVDGQPVLAEPILAVPYTIGWMSDTQHYSAEHPEIYMAMTKYLKENKENLNLQYVAHTGDIVASGGKGAQWKLAREAMDELTGIPYGVLAGNHDVSDGFENYEKYFGQDKFQGQTQYGGSYKNNRDHYDTVRMGDTDYLFVYLSYSPEEEDMAWANQIFSAYPDHVGVLCVHEYLGSESTLRSMGKILQEKVVAKNPNLYLVLCGHRYTEDCIPAQFDDDKDGIKERTVYQCIANYQNIGGGGKGFMRFIEVDEAKGTMRFYTYSPTQQEYRDPPEGAKNKQPVMPLPWAGRKNLAQAAGH